jgi:hypothetical protein
MSTEYKETLRKAEIKRVAERLTKKELCTIYDFNYNFYMNCVSGRNLPSKKMADSLKEYLETQTKDVSQKVFANRTSETDYHDALDIRDSEVSELLTNLGDQDVYKEPKQ